MVMVGGHVDSVLVVIWDVVEKSGILLLIVILIIRRKKYLLFTLKEQMSQLEVQLLEA